MFPSRTLFRALLLANCFALSCAATAADDAGVPAGQYRLDRAHASLLFRVNHMGFSMFTARFTRFDATLLFDPAHPGESKLEATVDATSLQTDYPKPEIVDFNALLQNNQWLDTQKWPEMKYRASRVDVTGPNEGVVRGELTLRGVTKPVPLTVRFNGGYPGMEMDPNARVGFSAHGELNRSDFGMDYGIPAPGSRMGVSDRVEIIIEAEFVGPAFKPDHR
ncbi:MAG: polyisoprenoid-binding protein [Pseudomonadales bacterium]|nr:polyisoprenoid-binding protein [Pseudomonadales bacterium]